MYKINKIKKDIEKQLITICRSIKSDKDSLRVVGMALIISNRGVFITAEHVLTLRGKIKNPVLFALFFNKKGVIESYPVKRWMKCGGGDIGFGYLDCDENDINIHMMETISYTSKMPSKGDSILACSCKKGIEDINTGNLYKIEYKWFSGVVRKIYENGRDDYLLPGPCVETYMRVESGMSGGPVLNKDGSLIGIMSTGFTGSDEDISYFSPIYNRIDIFGNILNRKKFK